jgi:RHS repeat-associated protein
MFHNFAELGATPCLVRSTNLTYSGAPSLSFLTSIQLFGYIRNLADQSYAVTDPQTNEVLSPKPMPSLDLGYSQPTVDQTLHESDSASLENLPYGVDGGRFEWVDLDSEGSPGVLAEYSGSWFYKRNASNVPRDDAGDILTDGGSVRAYFEPIEEVATVPSLASLVAGRQHFVDLDGEGRQFLVQFSRPVSGYYAREEDGGWQSFVPFDSSPNIDWSDPNLRTVDLDGDGFADILITAHDSLIWYPSLGRQGFGEPQSVPKPFDEDQGPALVFADGTESIFLADFSGDGLSDLVRVRNGEVCYWPNLGFGHFGAKITLDNSPIFDSSDQFDSKRVRLADIDGSGPTDIIYLGPDAATLHFNQSGNSFSAPEELTEFPAVDDIDSVAAVDLLGNGTTCLVWSSALPGDSSRPLKYIDLMGGQKPHLLTSAVNNLGAEKRLQYAASTKFYLLDRAAGTPWITRLAFPTQVVERIESFDYVGHHKFVSLFRYHHGYFDGVEREFRGFGMVEQLDTESFSKYSAQGLFTEPPAAVGEEFYLPPVLTKTWVHTGAFFEEQKISTHFQTEYYQGDKSAAFLPDSSLPDGLTADETREACRALKGRILREEVFALDDSAEAGHPYTVTEHNYRVRLEQPMVTNPHAVFFAHESESLTYHYERNPDDPRIGHRLSLEVDTFGNLLKSLAIGYPRRPSADTLPEQEKVLVTYTENDVINQPDQPTWYRIGLPAESRTYELTDLPPLTNASLYTSDQLLTAISDAVVIPFEATPDNSLTQKRLIGRLRTLYRKDDLSGPLQVGQVESHALPYETYKMAFTPGLLNIYSAKASAATVAEILSTEGSYQNLDQDGVWWTPSGHLFYSTDPANPDPAFARAHFYLPQGSIDAFENVSRRVYDQPYILLVTQTQDALQNAVVADNDYRVLQPGLITDPNLNRSTARFDALGMVVATALMGKANANEGDTLADPTTKLEYDLFNWSKNNQPNFVHTSARELHGSANVRWQESYSYSDGLGREVMKKVQAEPGLAPVRDANGVLGRDANGNLVPPQFTPSRWVGSGRAVSDNKGNLVKKYEPFFDCIPSWVDEIDLVQLGVTPILRYDPIGRLIRTDNPDGSYSTVVFSPWLQTTSDENDGVLNSAWYAARGSPAPSSPEPNDPQVRAAWLTAKHANTPNLTSFDTLGRTVLTVSDNGADSTPRLYQTRIDVDVQGNQQSVTDALNRKIISYDYNLLGSLIRELNLDAGERWMVSDVESKAVRSWDSRNNAIRQTYDALRRPVNLFVQIGNANEILAERTLYGEGQPNDQPLNLRTRIFQQFDNAGIVTNTQYDFKGNLASNTRQILQNYKSTADWSQTPGPLLEPEVFGGSIVYDALNRPIQLVAPNSNVPAALFSVTQPVYNEASLLQKVDCWLNQALAPQTLLDPTTANFRPITNLDYNARGQRQLIQYGNGAQSTYDYDAYRFRLIHIKTTRSSDSATLQDLTYVYDPVGNITQIEDAAQETLYYNNQVVDPTAAYVYDPVYRLITAKSREHIGQLTQPQTNWDDSPRMNQPLPGDGQAMRNYTETYQYDPVGNLLTTIHVATNGNWTRTYAYDEPNAIPTNNHLTSTTIGTLKDAYAYDSNGNMTQMPNLSTLVWDYKNQLQAVQPQVVNGGPGERTYYVYDLAGQRVRKVTERANGTRKQERIYLGTAFEVYREYDGTGNQVTLERDALHVTDDKRRIALIETKTLDSTLPAASLPSTATRYQFDNYLGSVCLELDENAALISYEEYYPFGSTSFQSGRSAAEVSLKRYRYTSRERDEESGLYYHGARYYAPWFGRWTSCDPSRGADHPNAYEYVRNNPIRYSDLTGQEEKDPNKDKPPATDKKPDPPPPPATKKDDKKKDDEEDVDDINSNLAQRGQGATQDKGFTSETQVTGATGKQGGVTLTQHVRLNLDSSAFSFTGSGSVDPNGNFSGGSGTAAVQFWSTGDDSKDPPGLYRDPVARSIKVGFQFTGTAGTFAAPRLGAPSGSATSQQPYAGASGLLLLSKDFYLTDRGEKGKRLSLDINLGGFAQTSGASNASDLLQPNSGYEAGATLTLKLNGKGFFLEGFHTGGGQATDATGNTVDVSSNYAAVGAYLIRGADKKTAYFLTVGYTQDTSAQRNFPMMQVDHGGAVFASLTFVLFAPKKEKKTEK